MTCVLGSFPVWLIETGIIRSLVWMLALPPLIFWAVLSPHKSLVSSLCSPLLSGTLLTTLDSLYSPQSQFRQSPGIPLCSPSWPYGLQTCHGVSCDNCRSSFISHLLKVSVLCFLMSINLKTYFICFVFYFWLFGVGKLVFTCASKFMSAYYVWHGLFKVFGDMMMNKKAHAVTAA